MGIKSPACAYWEGLMFQPSRGKARKVDVFGDNVARSHLTGDAWRTRHDAIKWALSEQADWCQYKIHVEPSNKFLPYIRQREQFMKKKARQRQGLVPDFLDMKRNVLMDVKTFSWGKLYCPKRFKKAKQCKAVAVRAFRVHGEYQKKARNADTKYNKWQGPGPGPVARALNQYGQVEGLAVGAHGEASRDLLDLIDLMADRGATRRFRELGCDSMEDARKIIKRQVLMVVGIEAMRGMARLKLDNLVTILVTPASGRQTAARRARAKAMHGTQVDLYWARHCHFE